MKRALTTGGLCLALASAFGLAACQGCRTPASTTAEGAVADERPSIRLFVLSTVAGALEPCGCSKDQLGGIDHLAALIERDRVLAKQTLVVGAGPMLFSDPTMGQDETTQATWKAEAIAQAAKAIGLTAWAPGANDWAAGGAELGKYRDQSGAALLAANLSGAPGTQPSVVVDAGGIKVGIVGLSEPSVAGGPFPEGVVSASPPLDALRAEVAALKKAGARVLIGLAALPRGEALRIADALPELNVLVIGKPSERGDGNDAQKSPTLIGTTLVVETANHLQTAAMIDLHVQEGPDGLITFADGTGIAKADELLSVSSRIRDLEARINGWEGDKNVKTEDVAARRADLEKLRADKARLEETELAAKGSFFRYKAIEVRDSLGESPRVAAGMLDFYKRVNEHNKVAFADRKPPPVPPNQAGFVGVDACTDCHDDARKFWDATPHAHAYATLQKGEKEFNLDCVSCHVTGYGKPGGSTVTWNEKLQNVGCEECHGPGSLHAGAPSEKGLIITKPDPNGCVSACHHPPHVEGFDAVAKMKLVIGPGHGM